MMKKYRDITAVILFGAVLFGLALFAWIKAPAGYSNSERRSLAQLPALKSTELASGVFMAKFDDYSMDQFPMRDGFRSLKAFAVKYMFLQKDNNGLYIVNGYLSKLDYPLNTARLDRSIAKLNSVYSKYLEGTNCKVYLSLIPDKNCFLAPMGGYPYIPFPEIDSEMLSRVSFDEYIDISALLSIEDYYFTDQHWRQECITDVASKLLLAMTGKGAQSEYQAVIIDNPFYGAYVGQSALPSAADTIRYLTNDILKGCTVSDYSTGSAAQAEMYNSSSAFGRDPYEMFLNGSTPLIVIENPNAETGRELVVFRDSFGSALIPLLTEGYAKITVVDLRYMRSELLGQYISFENQDVLFLYSTLTLNSIISM